MILAAVVGVWMGRSQARRPHHQTGARRRPDAAAVRLPDPGAGAVRRRPGSPRSWRPSRTPRPPRSRSSPTASRRSPPTTVEAAESAGRDHDPDHHQGADPDGPVGVHRRGQPGPALRAVDGRHRRPGRCRARSATTSSPASSSSTPGAAGSPPASRSCCSASCSTGSRRTRHRRARGAVLDEAHDQARSLPRRRRSGWSIALAAARRRPATSPKAQAAERHALRRRQHRGQQLGRLRGGRLRRRAGRRRRSSAASSTTCTSTSRSPGRASPAAQVDAVLENWGHPELIDLYVKKLHVAEDAGQHRHHRADRLVRPAVDEEEVPRHHRLEEPEQVRRRCSRPRSPAARASCSTATPASSPTTRRWSRTSS